MSYLNNLRLVFAGDFQADVSTVNNDVRHFDNATFEERFQKFQEGNVMNGWWNPIGSGAFRLINCRVTAVYYQDGTSSTEDPIVGLFINGSNNRVGGKMVDLDPQWQQASELWGLTVRLSASGDNPTNLFNAAFEPAPFRDLWFSRQSGVGGDQAASALFQSVLTDIDWGDDLLNSRFLQELQGTTAEGLLSMRISTFSFNMRVDSDNFTLGKVVGAIGPYLAGEPHSFIRGRRMYQTVNANLSPPSDRLYFFDCSVDETTSSVFADLSNTLPLDASGNLSDMDNLQLAVLANENIQLSQQVTKGSDFTPLGGYIPYTEANWLNKTSGIWSVSLSPAELSLVNQQPLAIIKMSDDNTGTVNIRETLNGWLIRADKFVHRVEPGETFKTTLFAACYGKPFANANVVFSLVPPLANQGGGPSGDPDPPTASIPDINVPAEAVSFQTQPLITDGSGKVELTVSTSTPNNYRVYLDGQVYLIQYQLEGQVEGQQQSWDYIVFLLHDEYQVPEQPTWIDHIQPILEQYNNLYPIMSKRLVDLSNYESVKENRNILELAFSLPISDPNYMPVTRDLSRPKQETLLKWLRQQGADGSYVLYYGEAKAETETVPRAIASRSAPLEDTVAEVPTEQAGGKTLFAKNFIAAIKATRDRN